MPLGLRRKSTDEKGDKIAPRLPDQDDNGPQGLAGVNKLASYPTELAEKQQIVNEAKQITKYQGAESGGNPDQESKDR